MRNYGKGDLPMESRSFQMDTQWNVIYYPEKPTGFGVLLIGDERHFVEEDKCFWTQNEGKLAIINQLKDNGYTIFSSNFYGRNWGSESAVDLAERLYQHVMRNEILNSKIHILAEGMGALVAIKLLESMKECIRSVFLINPILSLKSKLEQEKENKFFYKKLLKELMEAHQIEATEIETHILNMEDQVNLDTDIAIKIIQVLSSSRGFNQSNHNQQILRESKINSTYILPEKAHQLGKICLEFFSSNETVL